MNSNRADPKRVLLVDDDAALLAILAEVLGAAGHIVVTAENGLRALETCRASVPDLVVTDIAMPEMDGLAFIRQAKREFASLPIVAMSGGLADAGANLHQAALLGAVATLSKPFSLDELRCVVERTLLESDVRSGAHAFNAG